MERRDTPRPAIALAILVLALSHVANGNDSNDARRINGIAITRSPKSPQYGGGSGEPNDPYLIYTPEQMNTIGVYGPMRAHFKLMADIDLGVYTDGEYRVIGDRNRPFRGTFDGNGHAISNFTYDSWVCDCVGLFGVVDDPNAVIKDLQLVDPNICLEAGANIGALVGSLDGGVIRHCTVEGGLVVGTVWVLNSTGGLVGYNGGRIINCHASCSVISHWQVGGLVGENYDTSLRENRTAYTYNGEIINCSASGNVRGDLRVGGLAGYNEEGLLRNCHATGTVSGENSVGGLVGSSHSYSLDGEVCGISANCYATGDVDGNDCVGGLVGESWEGVLTDCYATGKVDGRNRVGGLVGYISEALLSNCHAHGPVDGNDRVGGLLGYGHDVVVNNCCAQGPVTGSDYVGGLAGYIMGTSKNCYATGAVLGVAYVGGLAGCHSTRRVSTAIAINTCYSTGKVTGDSYTGGLMGVSPQETTASSFWDVERSGQTASALGEGVSTAAMQDPNTFIAAGWDFFGPADGPSDIWTVDPASGYPVLWWQASEAELPELPPFSEGKGTAEDPYLIASAPQLNSIGHNPRLMDAHFRLTADIDLAGVEFAIIGETAFPFSGTLDGDGWTVSNFTYVREGEDHVALVAYAAGAQAEIRNLILVDPDIDAGTTDCVGSLVGHLDHGTVTGCHVIGGIVVGQNQVGGLIGYSYYGLVKDCGAATAVIGRYGAGGLVGNNDCSTITRCRSTEGVTGEKDTGGLVGCSPYGIITDCYSLGAVVGSQCTGGLLGDSSASTVQYCYAAGAVVGRETAGPHKSPSQHSGTWRLVE